MRLYLLFALGAAAAFVAVVSLLAFHGPHVPPDPLAAFRPCVPAPLLGPGMIVCANLHSYHRQDGGWIDAGHLTPMPKVPRD